MAADQEQSKSWVEKIIRNYCASSANSLENGTGEPAWDAPQFAYAHGDDPLFDQLKNDIGEFYWTPAEAYQLAYPDEESDSSSLTVICYILPQTKVTRADQAIETEFPAERWARSRFHGEDGYPAVAPERLPGFD
jgi:hypothetical protein